MEQKTIIRAGIYFRHDEIFLNESETVQVLPLTDYIIFPHQQDFYEINIVTRGNGIHTIENNSINVKVGDVFVMPPNVVHSYEGGKGFDVFHLLLSDTFIRKNLAELQQLPNFYILFAAEPIMRVSIEKPLHLSLNEEQFKIIRKILDDMLIYTDSNNTLCNIYHESLCMALICMLCKIYSDNKEQIENEKGNFDHSFMNSISYIHQNFQKKITMNELSTIAHMSESSYFRKFKKICKMTPVSYINNLKIKEAKSMLINTHSSISEISFQIGFYDISHFTKAFISAVGISPANYRKKYSNK